MKGVLVRIGHYAVSACLLGHVLAWGGAAWSQVSVRIAEINPDPINLEVLSSGGDTGGRINGLAIARDGVTLYAASEWGGIFKSDNRGATWFRLNGHVPTATWDVAVDPSNERRIYATSFYDGRVQSRAGISVSNDAGTTWVHPPTATAPGPPYTSTVRRDEPAAFGIGIDPDAPQNVYIGTNTGLAISNDAGNTWRFVDPTPQDIADNIWDVVVHHGGIIDVVGDDGHRRSTDGGATWTTASAVPLPSGMASITVSPDEPYVLFATVGNQIYESDDGGASWPTVLTNPEASPQGRVPFVLANQRSGSAFDLWFGDVRLFRATCTTPTPPAPGGVPRAPINAWSGPFITGAHPDVGDIVVDPEVTEDACPVAFSNDGGVYTNTKLTSPGCHSPVWKQPGVTPHGLWLWGLDGAGQPGIVSEDLYFGTQDNGVFGTLVAGAVNPTWIFGEPGDVFDAAAEADSVQYTLQGPRVIVNLRERGLAGGAEIATYPPGDIAGFTFGVQVATWGDGRTIVLTDAGAFITNDVAADPIIWTELGPGSKPADRMCSVQIAISGAVATFYVRTKAGLLSGECNGRTPDKLWRFDGTNPSGTWVAVSPPGGTGGFGVFAAHPRNPNRIIASHLRPGADPQMIMSSNAGQTWTPIPNLDALMTGAGIFRYTTRRGPTDVLSFDGYPQPSMVAFSPDDDNVAVAGGVDSGIFLSLDGGLSWKLVTDPLNPGTSGIPHIPRPKFAHFQQDGDLTARDNQQWHQDSPGIVGKAEKDDHFGAALATGDFDGDGLADLAIGVPDEGLEGIPGVGTIKAVGAVNVLYGSGARSGVARSQQWHQDVPGILGKAEKDDHFGAALATGDFNGDGFADLAIGVPNEALEGLSGGGTIKAVGAVTVLYGSAAGLSADGNQQWHQDVPGIIGKAEKDDHFGAALAAGDFNGDGFADLAIGVPNEGLEGVSGGGTIKAVGAVTVLYGSVKGLSADGNQQWHQDVPGIIGKAEKDDHFGAALAAGDFNGDGFADLAIGVPNEGLEGVPDEGTIKAVGAVNVLYGSSGGLSASGDQQWHQDAPGITGKAEKDDHFGAALATGDFDGDGFADLAIGVPNEGLEGVPDEGTIKAVGAVNVLYGSSGGLSASGDQQWHQDAPGITGKAEKDDHFGAALATGDFDGDGFADLAIGVPNEGLEGVPDEGTIKAVGAVNVLYGSSGGLSASGDQQWHQDAPGITGKAEKDDHFGAALATGDFDGDGFADLAIGVPNEGLEGVPDEGTIKAAGAVQVLFGSREIVDVFLGTQGRGVWRISVEFKDSHSGTPTAVPSRIGEADGAGETTSGLRAW